MADLKELEEIVWQARERMIGKWEEDPRVVAVSAYDAVTTLMASVVEELQGVRRALESAPARSPKE
jgi:hypothetical protein